MLIALPTIGAGAAGSPDSPVHTGQSGEFYSQHQQQFPTAASSSSALACAPDSPVHHRLVQVWLVSAFQLNFFSSFQLNFTEFLSLKQTCLVHNTID
jgi:hypothetical protein